MKNLLLLFYLLCPLSLLGQENMVLWCHELNLSDGLTEDDYNFYVYCDSEEFTWISSTKGLNRFNGKEVKVYHADLKDSTKLYGQNIQSKMYEDSDKNLWFCTYRAIHYYDREQDEFRHFFVRDADGNFVKEDYHVFYMEGNKHLWFRAGGAVHRVDISKGRSAFEQSKALFTTTHFHLFPGVDVDGTMQHVFACSNEKKLGLTLFSKTETGFSSRPVFDKLNSELGFFPVFQIHYEAEDRVWLSTSEGLKRWNILNDDLKEFPIEVKEYAYFQPFEENYFLVSIFNKGVFRFDKSTGEYLSYHLHAITTPEKELDRKTRNIYLDNKKVLWITRPGEGVAYTHMKKRKFNFIKNIYTNDKSIIYKNLLNGAAGSVVALDHNGWFQMDTLGNVIDESSFKNISSVVRGVLNGEEELVFGTSNGLYVSKLSDKKLHLISGTSDSNRMSFLDLILIEQDKILATVLGQGLKLIVKKEGQWKIKAVDIKTKGLMYSDIFQSKSGDLFLCNNESNITVCQLEQDQMVCRDTLEIPGAIYDYYEDTKRSLLWIATSFGLFKVSTIDLQIEGEPYTEADGLSDNTVYSIHRNKQNQLWLATFRGLTLFDPETERGHSFSLADGMFSEQFLPDAVLQKEDGTIWFGGNNGITIVPKDSVILLGYEPSILITDFRIDGSRPIAGVRCEKTNTCNINEVQQLEYDHLENSLSFEFAATDYADPSKTRLQYKIEKVGNNTENWQQIKAGERAVARYQDLTHGEYQLSIQAWNSDANPRFMAQKSIGITILPRLWERPWFWPFVSILCVLLIYIYSRWELKKIRKTEELKTKIAISEMQALLGQMNPHFIFNSLQSINRFILKGEKKQASQYLGRFSGLIRMMLENSRHPKHLLETEIDFLNLYLKVEAQRFKQAFTYEIILDEEIDPTIVEIPSMMLQPFIENAIWHGISHRTDGGHIIIRIEEKNDVLQCTIEDNGVGRKVAAKIAEGRGKPHKSRAMSIVSDRLKLLFPKQQEFCEVRHEDVVAEDGGVGGTRAVVRLPVSH